MGAAGEEVGGEPDRVDFAAEPGAGAAGDGAGRPSTNQILNTRLLLIGQIHRLSDICECLVNQILLALGPPHIILAFVQSIVQVDLWVQEVDYSI